jgi:RHS repeat-associated protein
MTDGTTTWLFSYDGDGSLVSQLVTDGTTATQTRFFLGGANESTSDGITESQRKYYAIAGQIFAMSDNGVMKYILTDHLGSTVGITDASGVLMSETRYMPFGEPRTDVGILMGTDKTYTGQRDVPATGLMDYKARMPALALWGYSSWLGRFIQPDTLVPGVSNPQSWNRYSYGLNNPVKYIDPTGHDADCGIGDQFCDEIKHEYGEKWKEQINVSTKEWERRKEFKNLTKPFGSKDTWELPDFGFQQIYGPKYVSLPYGYAQYEDITKLVHSQLYMQIMFDAQQVSWGDIFIDVVGGIGDVIVVLQPGSEGLESVKVMLDLGTMLDLLDCSKDAMSLLPNSPYNSDLISTGLDIASLVPEFGIVPSGLDIIYQLSFAFSVKPYQQ